MALALTQSARGRVVVRYGPPTTSTLGGVTGSNLDPEHGRLATHEEYGQIETYEQRASSAQFAMSRL